MIEIGKFNELKVLRHVEFGVFLDGGDGEEILLPKRYVPEKCDEGAILRVFIYYDSEDRLVATTEVPQAVVGDFATLKVVAVEQVGAFLEWGLPKDLFLPYSEQTLDLEPGVEVLVSVYVDKSFRISSSMRLERFTKKAPADYVEDQKVDAIVFARTDLGYKALVDGNYIGLLYANEVFKPVHYGQCLNAFVKKVRDDGKLDLNLMPAGHKAAQELGPQILEELKASGDFLAITDKTSAEKIYELFGVSKKKYKIALGALYKQRLITIDPDGIRLNPTFKKES